MRLVRCATRPQFTAMLQAPGVVAVQTRPPYSRTFRPAGAYLIRPTTQQTMAQAGPAACGTPRAQSRLETPCRAACLVAGGWEALAVKYYR
jgi:hypothetical protein